MKKKRILAIVLIAVLLIGGLGLAQAILMPKYINDIIEGRLIEEYYDNAGDLRGRLRSLREYFPH